MKDELVLLSWNRRKKKQDISKEAFRSEELYDEALHFGPGICKKEWIR